MKRRGALFGTLTFTLACSSVDLYPIAQSTAGRSGASAGSGVIGGASGTSGSGSGGSGSSDVGGSSGAAGRGGSAADGGAPPCPPSRLAPGDSDRSVHVGSEARNYILHLPPSYDGLARVPLVIDFHGAGESAARERESSPYPDVLDADGVVMAFPEGLVGPAGQGWNVGPCCVADVDDVAFTRALVADIQALACIDPKRVYAVGVLTGGGMAHHLACHAADLFAAVAPAAFDLLEENVDDCTPARPISVISFRGTGDSRVPYEGGPSSLVPGMPLTFLGAEDTFEKWAEINGCTGMASVADANDCRAYEHCDGGAEVVLCTHSGGRNEAGDPGIAWPLLRRHSL